MDKTKSGSGVLTRASAARAMRSQGGFTLIEGLVVVALMAILGGIAVFAVTALTEDADTNACVYERKTILTAMWAAEASGDPLGSYGEYLDSGIKYFEDSGTPAAPVWGPTGEHPGAPGCADSIDNP